MSHLIKGNFLSFQENRTGPNFNVLENNPVTSYDPRRLAKQEYKGKIIPLDNVEKLRYSAPIFTNDQPQISKIVKDFFYEGARLQAQADRFDVLGDSPHPENFFLTKRKDNIFTAPEKGGDREAPEPIPESDPEPMVKTEPVSVSVPVKRDLPLRSEETQISKRRQQLSNRRTQILKAMEGGEPAENFKKELIEIHEERKQMNEKMKNIRSKQRQTKTDNKPEKTSFKIERKSK